MGLNSFLSSKVDKVAIIGYSSNCNKATHHTPPEGVGEVFEVVVVVFLDEVDEEGGKDQPEEPYVQGGEQLLQGVDQRNKEVNDTSSGVQGSDSPTKCGNVVGYSYVYNVLHYKEVVSTFSFFRSVWPITFWTVQLLNKRPIRHVLIQTVPGCKNIISRLSKNSCSQTKL